MATNDDTLKTALQKAQEPVTITLARSEWRAIASYLDDAVAYHRWVSKRSKGYNRTIRESKVARAREGARKLREAFNG